MNSRLLSEEQILTLLRLARLHGSATNLKSFSETYLRELILHKKPLPVELLIEVSRAITASKNDNLDQIKQFYQYSDRGTLVIEDLSVKTVIELRSLAQLVGDGTMVEKIEKVLRREWRNLQEKL